MSIKHVNNNVNCFKNLISKMLMAVGIYVTLSILNLNTSTHYMKTDALITECYYSCYIY